MPQAPGPFPGTLRIAGIDLAWGDRNPDGLCLVEAGPAGARVLDITLSHGDDSLVGWLGHHLGSAPALIAIDGPVVCVNPTGARPVDRLTHVHFGRFKCGCHPTNLTRCPRPPRLVRRLVESGFAVALAGSRTVVEVYPHPAMVRWFGIPERIPYKRGPVASRRREFRRLQRLLRGCLAGRFAELDPGPNTDRLLRQPWSKPVEDQTDALVCALIGYWHWRHGGTRTQVLGDLETGFLLIPAP